MNSDTYPDEGSLNPRPRIVVLNDSWDLLRLMKDLLEEEGYDVDIMHATEGAHQRIREIAPSLMILDMMIETPDSGWQFLQVIKLDPRTRDIPVIICSAASNLLRDNKEQLDQLDCRILPKPFDLNDLLEMVRAALGHS